MSEMKICLVCSAGGHLLQIQQLEEIYQKHDYFFITFRRIDSEGLKNAYYLKDPKRNPIRHKINFFKSLSILRKEKPDLIITTGAGIAIAPCYAANLLGVKVIYIESFSRITEASLTGRMIYPIADEFLVQWAGLLKRYGPKARFRGCLF